MADFEAALTNYYQAEAKADAALKDLQAALDDERIFAERLGKVVAKHLKQINKAGVCCE